MKKGKKNGDSNIIIKTTTTSINNITTSASTVNIKTNINKIINVDIDNEKKLSKTLINIEKSVNQMKV
ncbi:hypothetical protein PIROE2DRAFT_17663 [Piromyces sp. E2]|nr:hypothetical protein PIROE2DRAFT_17663 [Piromyces sp. E2]|eukprot:OUM57375.1 hypothetical protein PIROE2DRAFT_17663 [Piromyces sp. E2]